MARLILALSTLTLAWLALTGPVAHSGGPAHPAAPPPQVNAIRADRLGIAHISSASRPTPPDRYAQALRLGAGWNRWPIYWQDVQPAPDTWDWSAYDRQVIDDLTQGFRINAILIGSPPFFRDGTRIQGIDQPIFSDGTDTPGPGKAINPANPWASFVLGAVNRYKPGGVLSQTAALPIGAGIRVWEVWNEPDYAAFWPGTIPEYARLLKVTGIVVRWADPAAQVMFGGLLFPDGDVNMLAQVLAIYAEDPQRETQDWYFDIVAIHAYADPARSGWLTLFARETLRAYGIDRPIWVNETGVPVWDDYPGPLWAPDSLNRATLSQQAWYFVQSASYAWSQGAERVFLHQLYDDCGDQPAGTDFPPHNGSLCAPGQLCYGDAHGIYRNTSDSSCFSQHPLPGTPRPLARAYRLVADVFGTQPFQRAEAPPETPGFVTLRFLRPLTNERITVMWNRRTEIATLTLPAAGRSAQLVTLDAATVIEPGSDGTYAITLPPALPDIDLNDRLEPAIGGAPYILIETIDGSAMMGAYGFDAVEPTPDPRPTPIPTPTVRPTVDPAQDTRPPQATVLPLAEASPPAFRVFWDGSDDSGIASYVIWVQVDGGPWEVWLNTTETSSVFNGEVGRSYAFAAWAVDLAGNWSQNIDLQAQASTRVQ